jgi:hypothetical protein
MPNPIFIESTQTTILPRLWTFSIYGHTGRLPQEWRPHITLAELAQHISSELADKVRLDPDSFTEELKNMLVLQIYTHLLIMDNSEIAEAVADPGTVQTVEEYIVNQGDMYRTDPYLIYNGRV